MIKEKIDKFTNKEEKTVKIRDIKCIEDFLFNYQLDLFPDPNTEESRRSLKQQYEQDETTKFVTYSNPGKAYLKNKIVDIVKYENKQLVESLKNFVNNPQIDMFDEEKINFAKETAKKIIQENKYQSSKSNSEEQYHKIEKENLVRIN